MRALSARVSSFVASPAHGGGGTGSAPGTPSQALNSRCPLIGQGLAVVPLSRGFFSDSGWVSE